ncbi:acyl-protein synthetase [Cyanosarcina cf. burmensis CCALA 770]|nr:acyl-protein synthetase [Cyanosarcina cf. burmensis CCALA 770]
MLSIERLLEEALSLPGESRALLAEKLVESLEFDADPRVEAAWINEAKQRRDEIQKGNVLSISGDEALAHVRRLLE